MHADLDEQPRSGGMHRLATRVEIGLVSRHGVVATVTPGSKLAAPVQRKLPVATKSRDSPMPKSRTRAQK
ncbi:MAG: hypothetical protein DI543_21245 [Bradyrhizobium icense]|jgi:hypothetical protein|nr:MAG: hypothetical protein DI543_21245 [Bradyrhizobium icense]